MPILSRRDPEIQTEIASLVQGLQQLGWVEGKNVRIDRRFIGGDYSQLSTVVKELIDLQPDIIFAVSTPVAAAFRQQTLSLPIVFVQVTDPVAIGLVASLADPGGNITGLINFEQEIGSKWLQAIKEAAPITKRVAVIFDPGNPSWIGYMRAIEGAAPSFEIRLVPAGISNPANIELAIEAFAREANGGMVVLPSAPTIKHRSLIIELAARHRLPTVYPYQFMAADGGLISYGVDVHDLYRRSATYVDRILKGKKPADLRL